MNIIVAGVMGRYPYGGVAWCSMMYLIGLQRLGHKVWYLEDMGECNFDPIENTISTDPRYALEFIRTCLSPYGLGDRWCYVDYLGILLWPHASAMAAGLRRLRSVHQPVWRLFFLARRVRSYPAYRFYRQRSGIQSVGILSSGPDRLRLLRPLRSSLHVRSEYRNTLESGADCTVEVEPYVATCLYRRMDPALQSRRDLCSRR